MASWSKPLPYCPPLPSLNQRGPDIVRLDSMVPMALSSTALHAPMLGEEISCPSLAFTLGHFWVPWERETVPSLRGSECTFLLETTECPRASSARVREGLGWRDQAWWGTMTSSFYFCGYPSIPLQSAEATPGLLFSRTVSGPLHLLPLANPGPLLSP